MVTEVHSKMYLPGYYSMKDLSNGAGYGSWSLPHESNSSKSVQHYGVYLSAPITEAMNYDVYEKEKLRQTIMKHESIFRQQVHELHRLYRKQRDLMNEIRNKEQSGRFSSGFHYEDDKRSWCASSFPTVGSAYGRASSSSVVNVTQSPQTSVKLTPNGTRLREYDEPLDLKFKKPQRRLFDLEAPAEDYMDDEVEREGELTKSHEVTRVDGGTRRTHNLTDLNEPMEVDEVSIMVPENNLSNEAFSKQQRPSQAGSTHLYSDVWCAAKQLSDSRFHVKNESREKDCLSYDAQAGKIRNNSCFGGIGDSSRVQSSRGCDQESDATVKAQVKSRIFGVEVAEGNNDASSFTPKGINLDDSEPSSTLSWSKPETGLNLNAVNCDGVSFVEPRKAETPTQTALPWLRASHLVNVKPTLIQDSSSTTREVEPSECLSNVKTILGFPIFDLTSKLEPPISSVLTGPINSPVNTVLVRRDDSVHDYVSSKPRDQLEDHSFARHQLDLNESLVEEEAQFVPQSLLIAKRTTGIDLEAPVILETDSEEESVEENLNKVAAEALFAIASSDQCNTAVDHQEVDVRISQTDSLNLLADIIDTIVNDVDEFENIVLNLAETEVEKHSYLAPMITDDAEERTAAAVPPRRPRRGQARRGRQRVKDFQSEVLPGMMSLSRNEVTEDLQMIEGLVRATGGTWQSSLASRSGGGRGRRRSGGGTSAAPPLPSLVELGACIVVEARQGDECKEAGIEETSLAGWGKRTRRPPRQRCPISNSLLPLR